MNSEIKSLIVSVMALAVAGGFSAYNTNEVHTTQQTIQDQTTTATADFSNQFNDINRKITALAKMKPEAYDDQGIRAKLVELENSVSALNQNMNYSIHEIHDINNKMIVVQAYQNKIAQATPQGKEMYSLVLLKQDGQYASNGEYLQSETVYISGRYDGTASKFDIQFKREGQQVQLNSGLGIPSDGVFSYVFNTGHNQAVGNYLATITINGKSDDIQFEIL